VNLRVYGLLIATTREVEHDGVIILLNLIFGWTVLGLIWAVIGKPHQTPKEPEGPAVHSGETLTVSHPKHA
jgi:hypothetical protein